MTSTMSKGSRYYTYDGQRRLRVPVDHSTDDAAAARYAAEHGAVNVVREDGPPSRPTGQHLVWQLGDAAATRAADDRVRVVTMDGLVWLVDPAALTPAE